MYVIGIVVNEIPKEYVSKINYTKLFWESGSKPLIFKNKQSAVKCLKQIKIWGRKTPLVLYSLKEEQHE